MTKKIATPILLFVFALQVFVPAQMVYEQEMTIAYGNPYKFKTKPIDPSDPFRGKYIVLNYEMDSFKNEEDWNEYKGSVYVYLKTDPEGFAAIKTVSKTLLGTSDDYVVAESSYSYDKQIHFELPFNRFYMNENKALGAEISAREAQRDTTKTCYGLVHVREGTAVLTNVYIDEVPIQRFVEIYQSEVD